MMGKYRFMKTWTRLPLSMRTEKAVEVNGVPYIWSVCYIEISNETKIGELLMEELIRKRLI